MPWGELTEELVPDQHMSLLHQFDEINEGENITAEMEDLWGLSDLSQVNQEVQVMPWGELTDELVPDQYMSLLHQFDEMEMEGQALDSRDIIGGDKMEAQLKGHDLINYIF